VIPILNTFVKIAMGMVTKKHATRFQTDRSKK